MSQLTSALPSTTPVTITWSPPPGGFLGLSLVNALLRVLTLGVYHFWGKTEVRQRIWSAVRVNGQPLEYRGTGGELCRGFLVVFVLVLVPVGIASFLVALLAGANAAASGTYQLALWSVFLLLSGLGIHRARRYRLSRTRWRGIRAGLAGRSAYFAWGYFWTTLLIPLTLGWILPWRAAYLQRLLFNETHFGNKAFIFSARAGPLYRRFWLVWISAIVVTLAALTSITLLLAPATGVRTGAALPVKLSSARAGELVAIIVLALGVFGLVQSWYKARMLNYFASHTSYQGASFKLGVTAVSLFWLTASNFLLSLFTLGVLTPIAQARSMRYIIDRLSIEGTVALQQIGQNKDALLRRGEGLAEAFNVDAF
jgi:uncharacterized membrane protein YjgN (DUF898 family)